MTRDQRRRLYEGFKNETDQEIERKRKVYLSFIVSTAEEQANIAAKAADLADNRESYDILTGIVQKRQRKRMRRETIKEWSAIVAPFASGILGALGSPVFVGLAKVIWPSLKTVL